MGELGIPVVQRFPSGQQFYVSQQSLAVHTVQGIIFSDIPEEQNWASQAARTELLPTMLRLTWDTQIATEGPPRKYPCGIRNI